ncbi:hypothetical protein JW960_11215 [candidate division KSB1 bacterium]|nr:hypothetical protein [candidate division KSB1 bacterium]
MIKIYDVAIATDTPDDTEFIELLEKAIQQAGLTTFLVQPFNLAETLKHLHRDEIGFKFLFDRASDTTPDFIPLQKHLTQHNVPVFDSIDGITWVLDKATMHLEFLSHHIRTPYTIIIPSYNHIEHIFLSLSDLSHLGRPFIIKPSQTTGGGTGVVDGAETLEDILYARKKYGDEQYLLQQKIIPVEKDGKRFWFRGFNICGNVECCWWNDKTHVYELITEQDSKQYNLQPLTAIVEEISKVCKLNFFSTEIAMAENNEFIVIDYVNEVCDMRLQSKHFDGVPDVLVKKIVSLIANYIRDTIAPPSRWEKSINWFRNR